MQADDNLNGLQSLYSRIELVEERELPKGVDETHLILIM